MWRAIFNLTSHLTVAVISVLIFWAQPCEAVWELDVTWFSQAHQDEIKCRFASVQTMMLFNSNRIGFAVGECAMNKARSLNEVKLTECFLGVERSVDQTVMKQNTKKICMIRNNVLSIKQKKENHRSIWNRQMFKSKIKISLTELTDFRTSFNEFILALDIWYGSL